MNETEIQTIKVLTVKQPFASLITAGIKTIENRSTRTHYRGRLYVHAGLGTIETPFGELLSDDLPAGAIIGHVDVIDCVEDSEDEFAIPGYFHWVLANAVEFETPISTRGALSFWTPKSEVLAQLP